ncbi:MAG: DUF4189 domain-containing protein [Mycobacterium sp.]
MANTRLVRALVAAGVLAGAVSTGVAWAGGPDGAVEADAFFAVGTGEFINSIVGFTATGATSEEASANVIAACQAAGGVECTADEVTNDNLCIASVASDSTDVVAGGAGPTVEAARQDAINKAAANGTPEGPDAVVVVSDCPS